ncbi:PucR family transcriptional regulator [Nocardia gamkensis]|uniref:PucR family transcriptional regulator n=1 Tax=Nocardia gamkensis TaxID=352869 RepID=A0A7X6R1A1_9NOCA|nr:helix-turn-helix domain-containing protein [Nocardia gamkensis]NKY24967.1 PucR family transcriptional regulator [Nocardia gamkensis]
MTSHSGVVVEQSSIAAYNEVEADVKLSPESRAICQECLRTIYLESLSLFEEGKKFEECNLEPLRQVGRIYAESGFSGESVTRVSSAVCREGIQYLLAQSPTQLVAGIIDFTVFSRNAVQISDHALISSYHETLLERGRVASPRELAGQILIQGYSADYSAPSEPAMSECRSYGVLLLAFHDMNPGNHAGRRLRGISNTFECMDVLWTVVGESLAILFPNHVDKETADTLHRRISVVIELPLVSALVPEVPLEDIPEAVVDCTESISIVRSLKYPPGCYDARHTLFERIVLSADPEMLGKMKRLIQEITSDTKLAETLAAWITNNGHRARTAGTLNIHPRTLDYRLRRIRSLVGLDPTDPSSMPLLRCASITWLAD